MDVRADHAGHVGDGVAAAIDAETAFPTVERRELGRAHAEDRHPEHLEHLHRPWQVENRLGASADHGHRIPRERGQVGRDISCVADAAVHAADPAGREHANASLPGGEHRRRDGGGAAAPRGDLGREVAEIDLHGVRRCGESLQFRPRDPDADRAVEDPDRGRDRAVGPHRILEGRRHPYALGLREAMRDERGLQGHHRSA